MPTLTLFMTFFIGLAAPFGPTPVAKSGSLAESSPFLTACLEGQASPHHRTIDRLKRLTRKDDCGALREDLRMRRHLYIGGLQNSSRPGERAPSPVVILQEFTQLESLNINRTGTRDLCPLTRLTSLRRLIARGNHIRDVHCLAQLSRVRHLNLGGNDIRDITPLATLGSLEELYVNDNAIEGLWALPRELRVLQLHRNAIREIQVLGYGAPRSLRDLGISGNPLSRLPSLAHLESLRSLDISDTPLVVFPTMAPHLRYLTAARTQVRDLMPLAALDRLELFYGEENEIEDLSGLRDLPLLTRLYLSGNPLGTTIAKTADNCPVDAASPAVRAWCT